MLNSLSGISLNIGHELPDPTRDPVSVGWVMTGQSSRLIYFAPERVKDKTNFTRVGAAFVNTRQDGSQIINIKLDFPVGAQELVLFEPKSKEGDDNVTD